MSPEVVAMIREWVQKDGDPERTARWMRDSLRIGGLKTCREMIREALDAPGRAREGE